MKQKSLIVSESLATAQDKLYAMIYVLLEGAFDTMDVLQETNMAILRHAESYDPARPALPWFKAFAMNQVLYYRRVKRDERLVFDSALVNELADILADEEVASGDGSADSVDLLEKCLDKLPPWQRELLKERYQKGQKVNEMARKRFLSRVSLSVLMFRIRKVLQACINGGAKKAASQHGSETEDAFIRGLEALFDGSATLAEKNALVAGMREHPELKRVYVAHARLHALMRCRKNRFFAEDSSVDRRASSAVCRSPRSVLRRVAAVAALFAVLLTGAVRVWQRNRGPVRQTIAVEECESEDEWLAQLTPLDLQAYEENMGFRELRQEQAEIRKYEPGLLTNPGIGIEVLALSAAQEKKLLLIPGDYVRRSRLVLDSGRMSFRLDSGAVITLFGPGEVALTDKQSLILKKGLMVAENGAQGLSVALPEAVVRNRNAMFCAEVADQGKTDVIVLSGSLQMLSEGDGRIGCVTANEGVRLAAGKRPVRFRCMEPADDLKQKFLSGNSKIAMQKRRGP